FLCHSFAFLRLVPPQIFTLFPYTTLFRSDSISLTALPKKTTSNPESLNATQEYQDMEALVLYPNPAEEYVYLSANRDLGRFDIIDRKSTRLNSSHVKISYAVFCLKKKNIK